MTYEIVKEEIKAVTHVIERNFLERYCDSKTSKVKLFEENFSKYCCVNYSVAVSSGTSALICCLKSLGIGHGDEVIIPSHTYVATALAVLLVGAIPVIVNIDDSLTIDTEEISKNVSNSTKAIIAVHMYGIPCHMDKLLSIAEKEKLFLIEDVAQACGGSFNGKKLGSIGNMGAFSFNHYKMISSGEGGAITTNLKEYYNRSIVEHHGGIYFENKEKEQFKDYRIGANYRLSEISGAILVVQLEKIDNFLQDLRREKNTLTDEISNLHDGRFYICPVPDSKGDCGRVFFFRFQDSQLADKFLKITQERNIDSFSAFSKGHSAPYWKDLLNTATIFEKIDSVTLRKRSFVCDPRAFKASELILKSTVGINTKYNRNPEDLIQMIQEIKNILIEL